MNERYKNRGEKTISLTIECERQEGELLIHKLEKIMMNEEAIEQTAPLIYTDRKDGVQAQYNIRTDRFDVAIEALNKMNLGRGNVWRGKNPDGTEKEGKIVKMDNRSNEPYTDGTSGES